MCVTLYSVPYFQRLYQDSDYLSKTTREVDGTSYTAYRPNHGVAHSLRQGFLVRDVITTVLAHPGIPLHSTILHYYNTDPHFSTKVSILSSFQRSGRQSEVSSASDPDLYYSYERQDAVNFREAVDTQYFCCIREIDEWSQYLSWSSNHPISTLLKVAHTLDLRRIPRFDKERIKREAGELLGVDPHSCCMSTLWDQSGKYLYISGDRGIETRHSWEDRFFILSQDPYRLYLELRKGLLPYPCGLS